MIGNFADAGSCSVGFALIRCGVTLICSFKEGVSCICLICLTGLNSYVCVIWRLCLILIEGGDCAFLVYRLETGHVFRGRVIAGIVSSLLG